ncbi:PREDICTED: malignant fibrous histiocytoma-amplified sequence 1 homolog [Branchiostoma belcheri]|uniref:Leucine-rich repeat protein SHOC-2 n=1 Tax=Branchiostoma belcheri TaxID=7741 RepID=A0A6P4YCW7_BRABE|nr:PREDICTED: malignant fibrous histiocytoma-amplified sequence 1 homolog [Branchiostoma belcheri]
MVNLKEWDMMGKRTLKTLDLSREEDSDIKPLAQLPEEVFELKELEALDLTNNKNIDLSNQLIKLTNLKVLSLRGCNLTRVPAAVMKLPQLEMLILSNNGGITLPDDMSGLTNLTVLHLDSCNLHTLPPVVLKLTNLQVLDISADWNSIQVFQFSLPDELCRLNKLKVLRLCYRHLDTVPPAVLKLPQLEELDLSGNSGIHLPDGLTGLTNLLVLKLRDTDMETVPLAVLKLPQLEELDLERTGMETLPAEIGQLTNVTHLDLSWCELRTLPPEVGRLTQLEWLNLSHNKLQTLPAEIGQLANVKHLDLSWCELRTFPPDVGRLTQLEWLDLSVNELQTLTAEIGQITNVKHLDLSNCKLRTIPPEVGRLTQLEWLNLSRNQLQTLPAEIGQLTNIKRLDLSGNPLIKPPYEVCRQGIAAIKQYFEELGRSEEKTSAHLKVVILGEKMAGKTSLIRTLDSGKSTLTEVEDRTHCVEITQWTPDDNITFEVYDFGGHDVYHLTHQFFLTPDAFYLLLVNLQTYSCSEERYRKAVGFWLDTLTARVPGAVVTIVGSKMDMCSEAEMSKKIKDIEERFQQQIDTCKSNTERQIKKLNTREAKSKEEKWEIERKLERARSLLSNQMRLIGTYCLSSAEPTSGLDTLRNHILESASDTGLFPTLKKILPRTWVEFEQKMLELPDRDASALLLQNDKKPTWLTRTDCLQQGQLAGLTADRLEPVLSYLQQVGTILRYTGIPELKDYVFHDPPALIEIFKDLFHHNVEQLFKTPGLTNGDYTGTQLEGFQRELQKRGLIRKDVMTCLLPSDINSDIVTALMQHFGLCFEIIIQDKTDPFKHTYWYRIPWYLQEEKPQNLKSVWPDDVPEDQEQLQLMCNIRGFCPRGLFQRFSVRIHQRIKDSLRVDWKDGVMAYRRDYSVLVCSKPVERDMYITMATRGRLAQADEMWGVVYPLLNVLEQLLQEWPGVMYSLHVTCAHCIKAGLDRPHQHELRDRTAEDQPEVWCEEVDFASTSADLVYRPARLSVRSPQPKRPQDDDVPGSPLEKEGGKDEVAETSGGKHIRLHAHVCFCFPTGPRLPVILLINDEYGTSKGGISTINCQVSQTPKGKAAVYCTVLRVPPKDQEAADRDGVKLITPYRSEGDTRAPPINWLTFDFKSHYPNLPPHVDVIVGHADITDTAARNIHNAYYKDKADLIMFTHVIPEDTDFYKGGRKAMKSWEKEKDMIDKVDKAKAAFSVGGRIFDHFENLYRGGKKPQSHKIFLPKPSELFLAKDVQPGGRQKVVLSIGRVRKVEKLKGHDLVGESMRDVVKKVANMRWWVRGISEDDFETSQKILEDALNSPDLNPTLRSYGTQDDIRDDMMTAHLVLMPSRSEPFGLVGLEAIAAGIPVLISNQTGLAEMITDLIDQGKLSPEHRHVIVKTSVNDRYRTADIKRWADRIVDILEHSDSEFEKAARFKRELENSRYWEDSHNAFLQACGITTGNPEYANEYIIYAKSSDQLERSQDHGAPKEKLDDVKDEVVEMSEDSQQQGAASGLQSEKARNHAFEVIRTANQQYQGVDFFAIEAKLPADGLSATSEWCRDYQNLCAEYGLRPTGCGADQTGPNYRGCVTEYNSDPYINSVLSCPPAEGVAEVANLTFSAEATADRSFGFHKCNRYCQPGIYENDLSLTYTSAAFGSDGSGDRIVYTVCAGSAGC